MECPKCGCNNVDRVATCWNCDAPLDAASALEGSPKGGLAPAALAPAPDAHPNAEATSAPTAQVGPATAAVTLGRVGANPAYVPPAVTSPVPAYPAAPAAAAPALAPHPAFAGAYAQTPAYAPGSPPFGALPPPPPTYPRVEPYVPSYRPTGEVTVEHAGFLWRLAAWALDTIILNVGGFVIGLPIGLMAGMVGAANGMSEEDVGAVANLVAMPLSLLVCFLYCTLLLAWRGQTVGMMACSLKVVHTDGMPIGFGTAVIRWICYFIAAMPCGLGLLWMIWDPECQGWHDKLAGTYVVRIG